MPTVGMTVRAWTGKGYVPGVVAMVVPTGTSYGPDGWRPREVRILTNVVVPGHTLLLDFTVTSRTVPGRCGNGCELGVRSGACADPRAGTRWWELDAAAWAVR